MKQMFIRTLVVLAGIHAGLLALRQPAWALRYEATAAAACYLYWRLIWRGLLVPALDRIRLVNDDQG